MSQLNLISNTETAWTCMKKPGSNLVYFLHSKCASSFYKQLFLGLDWQLCTTHDIDWNTDTVFSHIRDPLTKHRTGIIQWFYHFNKVFLLEKNQTNMDFFQMLSEIVYLDIHSMSLYEHLGDKIFSMTWIPIDIGHRNHVHETMELVKTHTQVSDIQVEKAVNRKPYHVSHGFKKMCVDKLLALTPTPLLLKSIEYDQQVYDQAVIEHFEPEKYPTRIKQLLAQGHTQLDAEQIADKEVELGQYLYW